MDAPNNQKKSDPAILLLNEIDILLAQTRLMDLYLKQAQATAANENAQLTNSMNPSWRPCAPISPTESDNCKNVQSI